MEKGLSPIQKIRARKRFVSIGVSVSCDPICPRSTKIGSRQDKPNRLSCRCRIFEGRVPSFDRSDTGTFVIGRKNNVIADSDSPGLYSSGDDSALVKSIDILHRKPQGTVRLRAGSGSRSSARNRVGPVYHFATPLDGSTRFTPSRAEIGINLSGRIPSFSRKSRYSFSICRKTDSE